MKKSLEGSDKVLGKSWESHEKGYEKDHKKVIEKSWDGHEKVRTKLKKNSTVCKHDATSLKQFFFTQFIGLSERGKKINNVSVLLSASVERVTVSRMHDFFLHRPLS